MTTSELLLLVSEWLGVIALAWIAGISPRFHRRPINFIYQRRENVISFSLLILALAAGLLVKAFVFPTAALTALSLPGIVNQRLWLAVILLAPFLLALLYRRQPVRTLGWGKTFRPSFQLGLGLLALIIFLHGKIFAIINHMSGALAILFLVLLIIALLEESVFRGFIFIRLTAGFGSASGLVMTALLSTIWQAALLVDFNAATVMVLPGIAVILVQSLVLGWVMKKSGHVIAPAMYAAISNMIIFFP